MTTGQLLIFGILVVTLGLFVWNRWRYDLVALTALMAVGLARLVPLEDLFSGFGHPAVVTVAAVLVISRGLMNAGVVDALARVLIRVGDRPVAQMAALTGLVAVCSAFMNNVGALALLMPVAVLMSRRSGRPPGLLLMPLAFGSLLGGMMTMIGTPPNIIIAMYRYKAVGDAFGMFDFMPVGGAVTLGGFALIVLVAGRLVPVRGDRGEGDELFRVSAYLTEVLVTEGSKYAGRALHDLLQDVEGEAEIAVIGRFHGEERQLHPSMYAMLKPGDVLLISASPDSLKNLLSVSGFQLADEVKADKGKADKGTDKEEGREDCERKGERKGEGRGEGNAVAGEKGGREDLNLHEVIVTHDSPLLGKSARILDVRERYGVTILGLARRGHRLRQRIDGVRFQVGDILLIQAADEGLGGVLSQMGCLPLPARGLRLGKPKRIWLALTLFTGGLVLAATKLLPAEVAMVMVGVVMVFLKMIKPAEAVKSVDLSIIILLGAMIPVGQALEMTGGAQLIASQLAGFGETLSMPVMLGMLLMATALLSNVVNNAAAAILAAPIAVDLAAAVGAHPDAYLMAVAIGASSAFLTPIGHQSNTLVMAPGGYRFGDYWRLGLPLTVVVTVIAVPMLMLVFGR